MIVEQQTTTLPRAWAAPYVGIPYLRRGRTRAGASCWGVVWLILREVFGRDVPLYGDEPASGDPEELAAKVQSAKPSWQPIAEGSEQAGDVVLCRVRGKPCHCGLVISGGRMIHTLPPHNSVVEHYDRSKWAPRVDGFYRWKALACGGAR